MSILSINRDQTQKVTPTEELDLLLKAHPTWGDKAQEGLQEFFVRYSIRNVSSAMCTLDKINKTWGLSAALFAFQRQQMLWVFDHETEEVGNRRRPDIFSNDSPGFDHYRTRWIKLEEKCEVLKFFVDYSISPEIPMKALQALRIYDAGREHIMYETKDGETSSEFDPQLHLMPIELFKKYGIDTIMKVVALSYRHFKTTLYTKEIADSVSKLGSNDDEKIKYKKMATDALTPWSCSIM